MARAAKKETALTAEEKLAQALVPEVEQPYKVPANWRWVTASNLSLTISKGTTPQGGKDGYVDDLSYVIENHKELINDTLILVKADAEGKNITQYELFKYIHNILNIEGMDKVFSHIINSTHNVAILKLIETKFLNGTVYFNIQPLE